MIDIQFKLNGRKIDPNNIGSELEKALIQELSGNISRALQPIVCAEHGERPTAVVDGKSFDNLSVNVSGCCDAVVNEARIALGAD